jgi:DNA-binding response OmpR family regulator
VEDFIARRRQIQDQHSNAPSRVLLIDDNEKYTRALASVLAARAPGLQVETASDGFTAGIKCESLRPDIVTLDLNMPDMNGIEVCRFLRSMFGPERPRIVVLSAELSAASIAAAMAAGANSCVAKTTTTEKLLAELGIPVASPRVMPRS